MSIDYPVLDPNNEEELVQGFKDTIYTSSNGLISDFSPHSPLSAIAEGYAYSAGELLWYVNKLPRALAIAFLKLAGVERNLGNKARVKLTFTLTQILPTVYEVPEGFEVRTQGNIVFRTLSRLIIEAGFISGEVLAECDEIGKQGNVLAEAITTFTVPMAYLQSVRNKEASYGGEDVETLEVAEERAISSLRIRDSLITIPDFKNYTEQLLASGRAVIVPLLGKDKKSKVLGCTHVFGINGDGSVPTSEQISDIEQQLSQRITLGTTVYFSPVDLLPLDITAVVEISSESSVIETGNNIYNGLLNFINPLSYGDNDSVNLNDLEYIIKDSDYYSIRRVSSVVINGLGSDRLLPNEYTLPVLNSLYLELIMPSGEMYSLGFGTVDVE